MSEKWHIRQYRPNYFSGLDTEVYRDLDFDKLLDADSVPFLNNFKHDGFIDFKIEPYSNGEMIISAKYKNGESWVAAFACQSNHPLADGWRYALNQKDSAA